MKLSYSIMIHQYFQAIDASSYKSHFFIIRLFTEIQHVTFHPRIKDPLMIRIIRKNNS